MSGCILYASISVGFIFIFFAGHGAWHFQKKQKYGTKIRLVLKRCWEVEEETTQNK
jgi:hypothetical protein